jgi:hypothetical protein
MYRNRRFDWNDSEMTELSKKDARKTKKLDGPTEQRRLYTNVIREMEEEGSRHHRPDMKNQVAHVWDAYKILMEATGGIDDLSVIRKELAQYKTKKDAT